MDLQQHELAESLVDNYNLDTTQKAIMVDDLDQVLESNRNQLYRKTEIGEDGIMYYPESEKGEEDVGERRIQIGNNYSEVVQAKPSNLAKALVPLAAAGILGGSLVAAALLWPKAETNPVDTNTDTVSVVRIIE